MTPEWVKRLRRESYRLSTLRKLLQRNPDILDLLIERNQETTTLDYKDLQEWMAELRRINEMFENI